MEALPPSEPAAEPEPETDIQPEEQPQEETNNSQPTPLEPAAASGLPLTGQATGNEEPPADADLAASLPSEPESEPEP